MGSKPDKYYMEKALFEIEAIIQYTNGLSFEEFMCDVKTIDASTTIKLLSLKKAHLTYILNS